MNSKDTKEKRPVQLQEKHKKLLVYTGLSLLFVGVMYVLFFPAETAKDKQEGSKGMNVSIPQASNAGLLEDKESAYEQQQLVEAAAKKRQSIASLSELFQSDTLMRERSNNYPETPSSENSIGASVSAYKNIHQTLDNFYTDDNSETLALQEEIADLKEQLNTQNDVASQEARQMALLEKSYQMASKYLPASSQGTTPLPQGNVVKVSPVHNSQQQKRHVKLVQKHKELVVSSLQSRDWTQEQSFSSPIEIALETQKNTIKACVHQTVELTQGESVPIRLLESIQVGTMMVPKESVLVATPKLEDNRLQLTITSIQYQNVLIPVSLVAYDLKGQKGVYVPGTLEQNAVKEILTGLGNSSGSVSLNNSASEQLITDMGRGFIQGTSNYLKNKIQRTKITVKAGHELLLLSEVK